MCASVRVFTYIKMNKLLTVCLLCLAILATINAGCVKKEMVQDPFTGKQVKLCAKDAKEIRRQMGEIQSMADMAKMQIDAAGIDDAEKLPNPKLLKGGKSFNEEKKLNKKKNADLYN